MSKDSAFQQKLREEIGTHKGSLSSSTPSQADIFSSLNIPTYVSKQDSLLHHLTLEAVRLVSHVRKFSPHTQLSRLVQVIALRTTLLLILSLGHPGNTSEPSLTFFAAQISPQRSIPHFRSGFLTTWFPQTPPSSLTYTA